MFFLGQQWFRYRRQALEAHQARVSSSLPPATARTMPKSPWFLPERARHPHASSEKNSPLSLAIGIISNMEDHTSKNKKRVRDNSDDSAEVKRLREDLLGFSRRLGRRSHDSGPRLRHESFEEEIAAATNSCQSSPRPASDTEQESETDPASVLVVDLTSESGESNPDLGYLLEASDDELGLPPSENFSDEAAKRRNPLQQLLCTEQTKQTPHPTPQSRHLCSPRARPTRPHTHTPHANRVQWNESVSICTWPGVICNGEHDCNNLSAKSVVSPTHFLLGAIIPS